MTTIEQTQKAPHLSDRYNLINTQEIIDEFRTHSWIPREIKNITPRWNSSKVAGYQKHSVRLREIGGLSLLKVDDIFPEIVLINSHDGSSSFQAQIGLFRLVCSNGLTVSQSTLSAFKTSHLKSINVVKNGIEEVMEKLPYLKYNIEHMQETQLNNDAQILFAEQALELKHDKLENVNMVELLRPKRKENNPNSLWTIYNTIQEKFTQGGWYKVTTQGKSIRSRGIKNISQNLNLNNDLWELAETYIN